MIKILIVDDSRVVQEFMTHLFSSDTGIEVIGVAGSGEEAIDFVRAKRPDVITMDIHMPGMDGYEATRTIMETYPTPIVIVSSSSGVSDVANSFKLFEAGALAVVLRPPSMEDPEFLSARKSLLQTVKLMSEVKVVQRFPNHSRAKTRMPGIVKKEYPLNNNIRLIAIGASTGGPVVLQTILANLPKGLPVPVLIVQHIAKGFVHGFRDWLAGSSNIQVKIASNGEEVMPGIGYIAPDDHQMGILNGTRISLHKLPPENGLCPSVDFLFRSVAVNMGSHAVGVLLTGMGKDGARELKTMRDKGAITIVQDEASCTVFGMPAEAVKLGAADHIIPADKIAGFLSNLLKK
jgi:two-component system chemotaxis response regulator CheB